MIPSVTTPSFAPKPAVGNAPPTAVKTTAPAAPETARASIGEAAAGNVRAETAHAVDAPEQTALLPRLRDRETAEQSDRYPHDKETPTGPPPAFDETPLQRQARVAFDPPQAPAEAAGPPPRGDPEPKAAPDESTARKKERAPSEPQPTPRERAEVSFAETRTLSEPREAAFMDVTR